MRRLCVLLLLLALSAAPAWALTVAGRVVDGQGRPVAGVLVSDGAGIVASGPDGSFSLASAPGRVVAITAPPGLAAPGRWWWPAAQAARLGVVRLTAAPPLPQDRIRLALAATPISTRPAPPLPGPASWTPPGPCGSGGRRRGGSKNTAPT
jgi:hypothetical protein